MSSKNRYNKESDYNRFDFSRHMSQLDKNESKPVNNKHNHKFDKPSLSKRFEDDGFKPVSKKNHYNKKYSKINKYRSSESSSYQTNKSMYQTNEKNTLPDGVYTINGPGYFKRKSMVDKINNGILMSITIDIEKLYKESNPDIQPFIKKVNNDELDIIIWDYINSVETAHIHVAFDDYECDFINDDPADLLISRSKFMSMMSKVLFYQNCIDYITNSISINLPEYSSERQETINHVGIIGFAIHNDTPDSGIKTYELFHVIVFNMMNLFIQGYTGKAYSFKISPQGNRFNIELRYDMDQFKDVQEAIKHMRLIATSYYNKIFSHLICYGCKQEGQRKPFMKYSFDGYVARKKTTEETENKEEIKKEENDD